MCTVTLEYDKNDARACQQLETLLATGLFLEKENVDTLRPLTMAEVNAMLDDAEAEIEAGKGTSHEEVMREWRAEFNRIKQEEYEMTETV